MVHEKNIPSLGPYLNVIWKEWDFIWTVFKNMWVLCGEGRSESNLHILLQPWFELVFSQLWTLDTIFPPSEGSWACSCTNSAAPLAKGWTFFLQATHCKSPKCDPSLCSVQPALGTPEHIKMTLVKTFARYSTSIMLQVCFLAFLVWFSMSNLPTSGTWACQGIRTLHKL